MTRAIRRLAAAQDYGDSTGRSTARRDSSCFARWNNEETLARWNGLRRRRRPVSGFPGRRIRASDTLGNRRVIPEVYRREEEILLSCIRSVLRVPCLRRARAEWPRRRHVRTADIGN